MKSHRTPMIVLTLLMAGVLAFPGRALADDAKSHIKLLTQQWTTKPPVTVRNVVSYYINNNHLRKAIVVEFTVMLNGKPQSSGSEVIQPRSSFPVPAETSGNQQTIRIDKASYQ